MIHSELIVPCTASPESNAEVLKLLGVEDDIAPQYMVFKTEYGDKTFWCCWSGGEIKDGQVSLTPVGVAALEALSRIEADTREGIDVFFLAGKTEPEVQAEVNAALAKLPNMTRVCFVGDVAGHLQSLLPGAFGVEDLPPMA